MHEYPYVNDINRCNAKEYSLHCQLYSYRQVFLFSQYLQYTFEVLMKVHQMEQQEDKFEGTCRQLPEYMYLFQSISIQISKNLKQKK